MSQQQQPPVITIKMVPAGVELVLTALNQLPRGQVDGLFQEIAGQYGFQLQELQAAQQAQQQAQAAAQEQKAVVDAAVAADAAATDEVQA